MKFKNILTLAMMTCAFALTAGCVSEGKFKREVSAYDQLKVANQQLKAELEADEATIQMLQNELKVTMLDSVLFAEGSAKLNDAGKSSLASIAPTLAKLKGPQIIVRAFTDNTPIGHALQKTYRSNLELSSARADVVVEFLREKGVPMANMSAQGFGEAHPIAGNDSADGRRRNRRVEIIISNVPVTP